MTEQKSTTTIEVLAPARRCVVSGWQPSESLAAFLLLLACSWCSLPVQ